MSNIIHKVKDALTDHGDKSSSTHHDSTKSSNYGPHDSNIANAADPRIDSDRSNLNTHNTTTTGHSSTQPLVTGAGVNTYDSARSSNYGPHDSNMANKVDPRVDSDRDGRAAYGAHTTSTGVGSTGLATGTGANAYESTRSSNHGPHDSNIANTMDPRVDSDRSNLGTHGAHYTTAGTTSTGLGSHTSSTGFGSGMATGTGANAYESTRSSNHGPHDSNMANTMDPRVDSDRSNMGTHGSHHHSTGHSTGLGVGAAAGAAAGAYGHHESNRSSNHGPHDSNIANKVDPRVDSDRDNSAAYGSHTAATGLGSTGTTSLTGHHGTLGDRSQHAATHSTATGPASSTAGPHENNLANKADPRVDSDLSKEHSGRFEKDVHKGSIGGAGVIPISGNAGPTSTKTFEEAQRAGAAGAGSSYNTAGSGLEHKKTAGPHKSDMANKLDPRVDSDLDGSKTLGGSQRA
ncbi:uncharacterized protein N7496_007209 [Penicillium cataractarum]|uniref:Uncharacterized protein n=1 Tax=Penicillium cataractarum TaxID=2100454 RepID=A0A9W9S3S1_9EURO|nr:uncharacterized protein N7496_007209 [Penicillium cataractarum]KAJ5371117.1 hypothetical protein N7496_007209 [Penicillium cataractarum]